MTRLILKVGGMSCGHCKSAIETALMRLKGMQEVKVALAEKKVLVEFEDNQLTLEEIKKAISDEGYEVMY